MSQPLACLRCQTALSFLGNKQFHEGSRSWGFFLGNLGELFVNQETLDVYACPSCGHVELFAAVPREDG